MIQGYQSFEEFLLSKILTTSTDPTSTSTDPTSTSTNPTLTSTLTPDKSIDTSIIYYNVFLGCLFTIFSGIGLFCLFNLFWCLFRNDKQRHQKNPGKLRF
jgi:hypothetical protein